jgi:hypothetical protein
VGGCHVLWCHGYVRVVLQLFYNGVPLMSQ